MIYTVTTTTGEVHRMDCPRRPPKSSRWVLGVFDSLTDAVENARNLYNDNQLDSDRLPFPCDFCLTR